MKNHSINSINDIEQALSISKTQVDAPKKSVYKKNEFTQQLNATISVQVNVLENSTKSAAPIVEAKPLTPQ